MRGDTHVLFGGRARETDPGQPGHRARARPNRSDTPGSCPTSDHRWSATQARLLAPHRAASNEALEPDCALRYPSDCGSPDGKKNLTGREGFPTCAGMSVTERP